MGGQADEPNRANRMRARPVHTAASSSGTDHLASAPPAQPHTSFAVGGRVG